MKIKRITKILSSNARHVHLNAVNENMLWMAAACSSGSEAISVAMGFYTETGSHKRVNNFNMAARYAENKM